MELLQVLHLGTTYLIVFRYINLLLMLILSFILLFQSSHALLGQSLPYSCYLPFASFTSHASVSYVVLLFPCFLIEKRKQIEIRHVFRSSIRFSAKHAC